MLPVATAHVVVHDEAAGLARERDELRLARTARSFCPCVDQPDKLRVGKLIVLQLLAD